MIGLESVLYPSCPTGQRWGGVECGCQGRNPDHHPKPDTTRHPEPEVRATRCSGSGLPGGAVLVAKAAAPEWFLLATYARGTRLVTEQKKRAKGEKAPKKKKGEKAKVKAVLTESVAIKGQHPAGRRFVVVYARSSERWSVSSAWVGEEGVFRMVSVAEVKEWVRS